MCALPAHHCAPLPPTTTCSAPTYPEAPLPLLQPTVHDTIADGGDAGAPCVDFVTLCSAVGITYHTRSMRRLFAILVARLFARTPHSNCLPDSSLKLFAQMCLLKLFVRLFAQTLRSNALRKHTYTPDMPRTRTRPSPPAPACLMYYPRASTAACACLPDVPPHSLSMDFHVHSVQQNFLSKVATYLLRPVCPDSRFFVVFMFITFFRARI